MKNKNIIYISLFLFLFLLTGCTKKHTHNYSIEWEWGEDVVAIFTCDCGEDSTQKLLANVSEEVIVEPDCINDGKINVKAKVMFNNVLYEKTKTVTTPKKGHDIVTHEEKAPTCTEKGLESYECTRCDYTTYKEIEAGHDISIVVVEPGFASAGYTADICSRCNCILNKYAYTPPILKLKYISAGYYVVAGVNDYNVSEIVIPQIYNGSIVLKIESRAFENCRNLTSIKIPNSVSNIGSCAFNNCRNLTSIEIPNNVTNIEEYAFAGCTNLTSITIPDSVTSIGDYAFENCTNLTSITIPDSVTNIGPSVFRNCTNLTSIEIPDSITSIGDSAFKNCRSLTNITIPDSITGIGPYAFYYCNSLTNITIPEGVTYIGTYAFYGCSSLTIYCKVSSQPSNWVFDWNYTNCPVVWGYK